MSAAFACTPSSSTKWDKLNNMILGYYEKVRITEKQSTQASYFTKNMQWNLRMNGLHFARLDITGSMCNGFGTKDSDLDICVRMEADSRPQGFDENGTLDCIAKTLVVKMGVKGTVIRNARVKIIKCDDKNCLKRPVDISVYNTLPLYNTKLLAKYCEWEPKRLPALGVWVKKWAKTCNIGDASEGTLSSYAWIVILINYLQNCSPPVLPRLQEEFRTSSTAPELHQNCDVYFHKEVVENWSSNTQSVGELFYGFLTYLENFDWQHKVIQIRRKSVLTKWEKKWEGQILIEDPFVLGHNMAYKRDRNVMDYIAETIKRSRNAFLKADDFVAEKVLASCRLERPLVIEGFRQHNQSNGAFNSPKTQFNAGYRIPRNGLLHHQTNYQRPGFRNQPPAMGNYGWGAAVQGMQNISLRTPYYQEM